MTNTTNSVLSKQLHPPNNCWADKIIGEKSMGRALILICITVMLVSGCTTVNRIFEKDGKEALLIECGAAVSFSVCHDRAKRECPNPSSAVQKSKFLQINKLLISNC